MPFRSNTLAPSAQFRSQKQSIAVSMQASAAALGPGADFRLLIAEWTGVRTEDVARESWAWSHSSRQNSSSILQLTAQIEEQGGSQKADRSLLVRRKRLMTALIQHDYSAYVQAATTLGGLIDRQDLPNVQDIPHPTRTLRTPQRVDRSLLGGTPDSELDLVPDCTLPNVTYSENVLDRALLFIFRGLVAKETGYNSEKEGILGLLEQAREYMLRPGQTAEAQHKMVYNTLAGLMTPVMPPIYKTFMSGIINGKKIGPWFYAPALTSWITPTFFGFLVGPSRPNRRRDGSMGGLVVEKCKFLQESGCKGICLNQCKLPAQQFFQEGLGLPLNVVPNFETQECQWSFGEEPLPVEEDPAFPAGCLTGCPTREALRDEKQARACG
eukprot:CAMPEP_0177694954 /NCGR_PEP_ID=MMETSP0484_2-20121128/3206_1 /TAXON_ID=354590 /ORGANISM="Rhodomonas lens, Strain RHODO" /LENGTH=382 /DNA_ID=CAMNT_0019205861 /DNA_START=47 /DNA_END=1195 /DNA_ORIENTATION=-